MKNYIFREYGEDRVIICDIADSLDMFAPMKIGKFHLIMVEKGNLEVDVNHKIFNLGCRSTIHLSNGDIIRSIKTSKEIKGYHLIFSTGFQSEMRASRKSPINIQLKKEFPFQEFSVKEFEFLINSILRLKRYITDTGHHYQGIVIKNEVQNLLLDISDKRRKDHGNKMDQATRKEVIVERFKNLVNGHCDEHHDVSWYADAIMITPDYLSRIIREKTGNSALAMINENIISRAESLMRQSDLSLKEISDRLHFTDQSSFGRFFKANTGMSPTEYRKSLNNQSTV